MKFPQSSFFVPFLLSLLMTVNLAAQAADRAAASADYEKGISAFNQADFKAAVIHLKNALQNDDGLLAASVLLGKTYLKLGDAAAAQVVLTKANQQGADATLTMKPLADALLMQSQYDKVIEQIPSSGLAPKLQADLLDARGEAFQALGKADKAIASYQAAAKLNPAIAEPYLGMATVAISQTKYNDAEKYLARAMGIEKDSVTAWQLKGSVAYERGEFKNALLYFNNALKLQPDDLNALLGRAGIYRDQANYQLAKSDVDLLVEKYPLDPRAQYLYSVIYAGLGKADKAQQALNDAVSLLSEMSDADLKTNKALLLLAGVANYDAGHFEVANNHLANYVSAYPGNDYAERLLGKVLLNVGDERKALSIFEKQLKRFPRDYELLTLMGASYSLMRQHKKANKYFDMAESVNRQAVPAQMQRAIGHVRGGREDEAKKILRRLLEKNNNTRAGLMLIGLNFQDGDMEMAEANARKLVAKEPDNQTARNFLGVALLETGKLREARQHFLELEKQDKDYFPAQMNLAKIDMIEHQFDAAEKRLNTLLEKKRNLGTVMLALSNLEKARGNIREALRWSEKAYSQDKKNLSIILALTERYLDTGDTANAVSMAQNGLYYFPGDFRIVMLSAEANLRHGQQEKAKNIYHQAADLGGLSEQQRFLIAKKMFEIGDIKGSEDNLQQILASDPGSVSARQAMIEIFLIQNEDNKAKQQLDKAKSYFPAALYQRLFGDWQMALGKVDNAVKHYENALELKADAQTVIRLSDTYRSLGKTEKAIAVLDKWQKAHPEDLEIKMRLADALASLGKSSRAAELYREVIKQEPTNAMAYNNLANIYQSEGKAEAEALARKAHDLDETNPMFNDTLGWILVESGQADAGLPFLRSAFARASTQPEIRYHIAKALFKLKRYSEARVELDALLASGGLNPDLKLQAEALLDRLK